MRASSLLLMASLLSCETTRIRATVGELSVSPRAIDFEQVFVGFPVRRAVVIQNRARSARTLSLATTAPFSAPATVELPGGAELVVEIALQPTEAGAVTGTVSVGDETETFIVELAGTVTLPPSCAPQRPCEVSVFDPDLGRCVASQAVDGASCADACVMGTCAAGRCVGSAVSCADANPCTVDACESVGGCRHRPVECASPANPCKVARCDPSLGCVENDVRDGTACGENDCVTAHVCVLGECKPRPAPDGAGCGPTTICQQAGTCVQSVCVQPAPTSLVEAWSYVFPGSTWNYSGAVTDAAQNLYWLECAATDCSATSYTAGGGLRFRTVIPLQPVPGLHHLISRDQLVYAANDTLGAVATANGAPLWSMQVPLNPPGAPDIADGQHITAIAAGPSSIIVAVARTSGQTARQHLVLSVDAVNNTIGFARFFEGWLDAPVLDEQGDVFLGVGLFSSMDLVSLSPSGVERWRQVAPLTSPWSISAPVAAFNGELLLEHGEVRSTVDGALRVGTGPGDLLSNPLMGTRGRLWLRELQSSGRINAFSTSPGVSLWTWETLVDGMGSGLVSGMVADASGGLLVAVGGTRHPTVLTALGPQGVERFSCEVPGASAYEVTAIAATLLDDRWVALEDRFEQTPRLRVFEVPGARPATHGWVSAMGSPSGNRRPMP